MHKVKGRISVRIDPAPNLEPGNTFLQPNLLTINVETVVAEDMRYSRNEQFIFKLGGAPLPEDLRIAHVQGDVVTKFNEALEILINAACDSAGIVAHADLPSDVKSACVDPSIPRQQVPQLNKAEDVLTEASVEAPSIWQRFVAWMKS